jgi:DNA-binding beta-propeller fold protein YncE
LNPLIDIYINFFIMRSNFDGSSTEVVIGSLIDPQGVAVDPTGGKVYWTDSGATGLVQRANLDGTGVEDIVTGLMSPRNITLDPTSPLLYWTDFTEGTIRRASLNGSNVQIVASNLLNPIGITAIVPEPSTAILLLLGLAGRSLVRIKKASARGRADA